MLPNIKMTQDTNCCSFLSKDNRCTIHQVRPSVCRLFPLGRYWEDEEHFKYIVEKACKHPNDSIRFSVMFCILPYFGIDRGFSVRKFMELIKSDLRILGF